MNKATGSTRLRKKISVSELQGGGMAAATESMNDGSKKRSAVDIIKAAYGEKYDPMKRDSKWDAANLLQRKRKRTLSVNAASGAATADKAEAEPEEKLRQLGTIKFQLECILIDVLQLFLFQLENR